MTGRSRATAAERLIGPVCEAATVFLTTDRKKLGETLHRIDLGDGPARFFPDGRVNLDDNGRRVGAEL